ncbi:MAG: hypothetical protein QXV32_05610 [Conexivisphaerales archaeon]
MLQVLVPTAVSSFFTIEGLNEKGEPVVPLQLAGARGGGFKLSSMTSTEAEMIEDDSDRVYFDGKMLQNTTTHRVIQLIRENFSIKGHFEVHHTVPIPWGSGFGTSASTALGAAIAVLATSKVKCTLKQPSQIAHEAEIISHTGLGTVGSLYSSAGAGGVITRAGGPGICELEPFLEDYSSMKLVAVTIRPRPKRPILTSREHILAINRIGYSTLERVLKRPTAKDMLNESRRFAQLTGIMTEEVDTICGLMVKGGAIAATQNMIGDAAHCIVKDSHADELAKMLRKEYPSSTITVSEFYEGGIRINIRQRKQNHG